MTVIMSFSSAPDTLTLGRVAGALAVYESFVEKDWYVVQAINALIDLATPDITPVFSGGTSLLKGHQLIKRFSEDIDCPGFGFKPPTSVGKGFSLRLASI